MGYGGNRGQPGFFLLIADKKLAVPVANRFKPLKDIAGKIFLNRKRD